MADADPPRKFKDMNHQLKPPADWADVCVLTQMNCTVLEQYVPQIVAFQSTALMLQEVRATCLAQR